MKLSLKVVLAIVFAIGFSVSSCSNQRMAAPPVANLPEEVFYTPTVMVDAAAPPEPAPTSEPTPTAEVKICRTSTVRAIPEYHKKNLLTSFQTVDPFVVLTIDDGYSNTVFNQMLEILKAHDTSATFFLVGASFGEKSKKKRCSN